MRSLLLTLLLAAIILSCGEAGFGFDVAGELALEAPTDIPEMVIPIPDNTGIPDINAEAIDFNYDLGDVNGFQDAIDELNSQGAEAYLLGLAYEFSGINDDPDDNPLFFDEEVPIESIRLEFAGTTEVLEFPLSGSNLQNTTQRQELVLTSGVKSALESILLQNRGLDITFVVDPGTVTLPTAATELDFLITVYVDVALRVRDINN